ncbi:alpha/beta hydrolase [Tenacibaculum sp. M341]|uniref:alpha/beta hydrolase n=1 Tax=Tenacibaculum sp. M341 TaxID=2530339 RepID=UPI00104C14C3|nr:esterase [Tenacibaculum sp. M341]TCI90657.1 esterase [Tenacibaculum sp. M341]
MEKSITYQTTNTYETLNEYSQKTKNVWLVFHGIGYLSRFFIRHFSKLPSDENYIICPQAPSKYYKDANYKRVGASWLTKENTITETQNVLNYIDTIISNEQIDFDTVNFIVLGYSQGVSIATRWLALRKQFSSKLIMVSGVFPKELNKEDFNHLPDLKTIHSVGLNDEIFDPKNVKKQEDRILSYFPNTQFINHNGGHIFESDLLNEYLSA